MSQGQFEGDVESISEGAGGEDADGLGGGQVDCGPDGQLGGGGQEGDQDQGEEEQLALLQPGEDPGGALDQEQADEADHEVVGEADHPAGDEVVGGAPLAVPAPGHVPHLQHQTSDQTGGGGYYICYV